MAEPQTHLHETDIATDDARQASNKGLFKVLIGGVVLAVIGLVIALAL